ncbi:hypothetical protein JKF63_06951 [Porcisia hertigi]|uniref:Uncharacterized protein n=1 Tax=Porcisia hertigi TaxID=2761500 RepID=A0A836LJG0_9TRYP|nr:hypothetical protein JKF63_06951 [Porcisia hertigi]
MSELHHLDAHSSASAPLTTANASTSGGGGGSGDKTCFPLATVEYLPWRLHEYSLLQSCCTHFQEIPSSASAAVGVAQRALYQVLQLMELEYLDPVPPPAPSVYLLETAVQQCVGNLLVAMWRVAVAQDGSSSATQPSSPADASTRATTHDSAGERRSSAIGATATASSAMTSITALVQQTVALLLSLPWSTSSSLKRVAPQRGHASSTPTARMTGACLLSIFWTCAAQVQQQCALLAGKWEAAEALRSAATSDVQYDDGNAVDDNAGEGARGNSPRSLLISGSRQAGAGPSPEKSSRKGKAGNPSGGAAGSGKYKVGKAAEGAAQQAEEPPETGAPSPALPRSVAHSHPSVVVVAARFPHMALGLLLQLITSIESAGAAPRCAGSLDGTNSGGATECIDRLSSEVQQTRAKSAAGLGAKDSGDRKPLKNAGSQASLFSSLSEVAPVMSAGSGASAPFTGVQMHMLHAMYRGCVEALEVLLHGAAVAATGLAPAGSEALVSSSSSTSYGVGTQLGILTHATVLRDVESTLHIDDRVDVLATHAAGDVGGVADFMCASSVEAFSVREPHLESQPPLEVSTAPITSRSTSALLLPRCFLYNAADMRCLYRHLTWETLFLPSTLMPPGTAAVLAARGAFDDIENAAPSSVTAFRTLAMASSQPAITVQVGVALESWWRKQQQQQGIAGAKLAATTAVGGGATAQLSPRWLPAPVTRLVAMEACTQCIELLRVLVLTVMLQSRQHRLAKGESALTVTLLALAAVDNALSGADAPAAFTNPSLPLPNLTEEHAEYMRLLALSQVGLRLSQLQRRCTGGGRRVREVPLREFTENADRSRIEGATAPLSNTSDGAGGDTLLLPSSTTPQSLRLYRAPAALLDKVTTALYAPPSPLPSSCSSAASTGEAVGSADVMETAAGGLRTPMGITLSVLKPVVAEVASFLLRCSGELRNQWQRHRAQRQVRNATPTEDGATQTARNAATEPAPLSIAEREADEEATYTAVMLCVLTSVWRSGASGGGVDMQLTDNRCVASLVRSAESGFLELIPTLTPSSAASAAVSGTSIPPAQLTRLIKHGVTARRLADRVRGHLQLRVESLLARADAPATAFRKSVAHGTDDAHTQVHSAPKSEIKDADAPCKVVPSNYSQLTAVRDALTELTSLWVTVRWQVARLQAHQSAYTSQNMDLKTLHGRHEKQEVYGRTTAKELRILRHLEWATPVLPVSAKDEELRLHHWVAEQRQQLSAQSQSHNAAAMSASYLLLDALVCTALVPLNTANPSAQQRLLDEAIRSMRQAEETGAAKKQLRRNPSPQVSFSNTRAPTAAAAEALVLYTPLLLWCYISEAANVYGTREQADQVRAVLDAQVLLERPGHTNSSHSGDVMTVVTTAFIQRLMLQPRWSVLQAISTTTRLAYCRALSSMAAVSTSKDTFGSDALGCLQGVYRLVLALQIQRMSDLSEAHGCGIEDTGRGASDSLMERPQTTSSVSATIAFMSLPLAVDTAQQLVSAILNYFTCSNGNTEGRPTPNTAAAPLLLPPLVALCEVLLALTPSSPQWADAAVQLLAVRVLTIFKEQLTYVMSSTMTTVGATACPPPMADVLLRLLWVTLVHVWNNVLRNPNARQHRFRLAAAQEALWARRVFDGHQRLMQEQRQKALAAEATADAEAGPKGAGAGKSGRHARVHRGSTLHAAPNAQGGDGLTLEAPLPPFEYPGLAYLALEDAFDDRTRVHGGCGAKGGDAADGGASTGITSSFSTPVAGATDALNRRSAFEWSTVVLHNSLPAELVELFENVVLHVPALWPLIFSATTDGSTIPDTDTSATEGGVGCTAHEAVSSMTSAPQQRRGKGDVEEAVQQQPLVDSPADFMRCACQHATRLLRSQTTASILDIASPSASTSKHSSLLRLQGLPAVYSDVIVALRQYSVTLRRFVGSSGGATAASFGSGGSRGVGSSRGHIGGAAGGGGTTSLILLDVLGKYKDDPAYAKLAVHVVQEMLAMCSDAEDSVSHGSGGGGAASSNPTNANAAAAAAAAAARKRHLMSNAASVEVGCIPITARSTSVAAAAMIIADVRLIMQAVREQVDQNRRSMHAYLSAVDAETQAWLTRGGYSVGHSAPRETAVTGTADEAPPVAASGAKKEGGKAAAGAKKKTANRGATRKRKAGKSDGPGGGKESDDEDDDEHAGSLTPSYTAVTRLWSLTEQQGLMQLTCAIARWRRRRAAQTLRHRYTQYNMPFMAQLHLCEATLLHMGAVAQHTAVTHERHMREVLCLVSGRGRGNDDARAGVTADRKLSGGGQVVSSASVATTQGRASLERQPNSASDSTTEVLEEPSQTTVKLLQHCTRAALLFQYLWLPARVSTAVQLAVHHLRELRVMVPHKKGISGSSLAAITAMVRQLVASPLFCIAAVQHGYWDARRDVHAGMLQPTVMKVGADVSWHRRFQYHRSVPSLLSLATLLGQHEELQSVHEARLRAQRQRSHEQLQLRLCVEAEAATRMEAERDELNAKVHILHQAQELLPELKQSVAIKTTLLAAAELLRFSATGCGDSRSRAGSVQRRMNALQSVSVPSREAVLAAAVAAAATMQYFTFEGVPRGSDAAATSGPPAATTVIGSQMESSRRAEGGHGIGSDGSADAERRASIDAANYGRGMREATLIEQIICLAGVFASLPLVRLEAAYRVAQDLTAGRYAGELLPLILQAEKNSHSQPSPETQEAYNQAMRHVPEGLQLLSAARAACAELSASEGRTLHTHPKQHHEQLQSFPTSVVNPPSKAMLTRGPNTHEASASWRAMVKQYERVAKSLRTAGLLQPLGECLYEKGNLYYAASRLTDAAKCWTDALDCFLGTPHALEDWHRHRTAPPAPPSSGPRSLEQLLWIAAALSALANHAFPTDSPRATAASLLCALLVHQHWRLPGVVSPTAAKKDEGHTLVAGVQLPPLPPAQYSLLDVHHVSALLSAAPRPTAVSVRQQRLPTGIPGALTDVTRDLISTAQRLLMRPLYACYSGESAVLAAFSDFIATVVLQSVELTVEARLVRAAAAARLGSFSVAMRHIYRVCIGAGLPQPMSGGLLGAEETLPGFYSLGCAAALPVGATTAAIAATLPPASPSPSSSATAPSTFYKDEESPASVHNTAAVRAFLAACLPGIPLDSVVKHNSNPGNREGDVPPRLGLATGVLASAALEERYGACLTRRLQLAIAELLVCLGTYDPAFLHTAGSSVTAAAAAVAALSSPLMMMTTTATVNPSVPGAFASSASSSVSSRSLSPLPTASLRTGGGNGGRASPLLLSPPIAAAAAAVRGDRPANACTEACCYASALLQSLINPDVCCALTGQPPAPSSVVEGSLSAVRPHGASGAATASSAHAPKSRAAAAASAQGAAVAVVSLPDEAQRASHTDDGSGSGFASGSPCAAWLGTIGAIRQHALLLTAELLIAQGDYTAGVRWLTASIAEHSEAQPSSSYLVSSSLHATPPITHAASHSRIPKQSGSPVESPSPTPTAPPHSLKGLGFQGSDQALARFVFDYDHWVRVWLLICRCYSHLRQYPQLEGAAGSQGLSLCTAFGVEGVGKSDDSSTYKDASYWTTFQLYRLYALTQLGRMREASDVVAALELSHCAAASTLPAAAVIADCPMMGLSEDRCVTLTALRWWRKHQGVPFESNMSLDNLMHLTRLATAEHGVLPWRPLTCVASPSLSSAALLEWSASQHQRHYVLVSPCAYSILPSLVLSRCAGAAKLWRLHDAMNHYALEQQAHQPVWTTLTTPASMCGRTEASSSEEHGICRTSKHRFTTPILKTPSNNTNHDPTCTSLASGVSASVTSDAAASLMQALEAVSPQYDTAAHSSCWLESQLWVAQLKVREVCTHLLATARAGGDVCRVDVGSSDVPGDTNDLASVAPQTGSSPLLSSREDTLRAFPLPVRDVCGDLLRVLHCCVELPVQRHAYVRAILLDLTRVVSTYARVLRACEHNTLSKQGGAQPLSATTVSGTGLVSQLDAIAAACTLLAGLVSDMERRVRTGADSLRGYATDARVAAAALTLSETNGGGQGQPPWPEFLLAALQRTQDTVGRLTPTMHNSNADSSGTAASADVLSHPFYSNMSTQQQQQLLSPPGTGGAPLVTNVGSESDRGANGGRTHKNVPKGSSASTAPGALSALGGSKVAQLNVPTMALTYAMLCDEAASAHALTPVTDALEHDVARQLLTRHLQRLSTPANCTYLCYRDDERQTLLESIGAVLSQQQVPQPQPSRRGGSGGHSRRAGPASSASSANAAAGAGGGGSAALGVRLTEADVWKALAPPLLLTAVPTALFSVFGPDVLGAPLYNSVAAAALCIATGAGAAGGAPTITSRDASNRITSSRVRTTTTTVRGSGHESRWQLYLCVSPLQDAEAATAPPALLTSVVASSPENCVLLPPSSVLNAAAASGESGATGTGLASSSSVSATSSSSRVRGASRQSAIGANTSTAGSHAGRAGGQVSLLTGSAVGGSNRGAGGAWWPPILPNAANTTREVLVPSTNWAYLDFIQHHQRQQLHRQRKVSPQDTDSAAKGPPPPSLAATFSHVARAARKLARKGSFNSPATALAAPGGSGGSSVASHKNDGLAPPCEPAPLRWSCVSFEVSGSTLRTLRRHLRAVRACMRRLEMEEGPGTRAGEATCRCKSSGSSESSGKRTEDMANGAAAVPAGGGGATAATAVEVQGTKKRDDHAATATPLAVGANSADSDSASDHAAVARHALATAVAQAQAALRSRGLTGGGGGSTGMGGVASGVGAGSQSIQQGAAADGSARAGTNGGYPGGSSSPGAASAASSISATSPSASSGRKAANKTNGAGRSLSHGNGIAGAGGADGLHAGAHVIRDDLADAARSRQAVERRRRLHQLEEELDEAKSNLLMELLETIVSAAYESSLYSNSEGAILDEARIEADVQRLLPRCVLSSDVIGFLEEWIGGHAVFNVHGRATDHGAGRSDDDDDDGCSGRSGTTSLRFYNPGLHEWMRRISRYIVEQQQQQ